MDVTESYVKMTLGCVQGSYIDLAVLRNATIVNIWLKHNSHAALAELEIFAEGKELWERLAEQDTVTHLINNIKRLFVEKHNNILNLQNV